MQLVKGYSNQVALRPSVCGNLSPSAVSHFATSANGPCICRQTAANIIIYGYPLACYLFLSVGRIARITQRKWER